MAVEERGWNPLGMRVGGAAGPADDFHTVPPFTRLARTHALSTAGDALVAVALAGSLFFSIKPDAARSKVTLYLLLTMAPFAFVAPLIGPAIDRARGGRRLMIVGSALLRGLLCGLMIRDLNSLLLFPEAFMLLVLQKGYQVARMAYVPTTVRTDTELVEANSKLALISGLMGFLAAGPGTLASKVTDGGQGPLVLAIVVFATAAGLGLRLPKNRVARQPAGDVERDELRGAGVVLAATAMALLRGIVGFLTMLLAFDFRGNGRPPWEFGVVAAFSVAGALVGAAVAPRLREATTEETMLTGMLVATVAAAVGALALGGVEGASLLGAAVGVASTGARAAFDSIVQRDAPDANRGRSFARFETRFQLAWVVGAFLPVPFNMNVRLGFLIVLIISAFASFSYLVGSNAAKHHSTGGEAGRRAAAAAQIEQRMNSMSSGVRRRMRKG